MLTSPTSPLTPTSRLCPVKVHLSDADFTFRVPHVDAYVLSAPVRDHASRATVTDDDDDDGDCEFPRVHLVSSYVPRANTPHVSVSPSSSPSLSHPKRALLAWRCPLCGTAETEKLFWMDQPTGDSSASATHGSSAPEFRVGSDAVAQRAAKLRERKRNKELLRRRSMAVSPTCVHCQLCPRCGGGGGLATRLCESSSAQIPSTGTPTVGLQIRMTRAMQYGVVCGYCQWTGFQSFEAMDELTQYLQALSTARAPVLRPWRMAQREVLDGLQKHPNFFDEGHGMGTRHADRGGSGGGVSYSRQAWDAFLRLERQRRQARVAATTTRQTSGGGTSAPSTTTALNNQGTNGLEQSEEAHIDEEDVFARSVRNADSTHRAVVLEALRDACRREHEKTYYTTSTANKSAEVGDGTHGPKVNVVPSYITRAPVGEIADAVRTRLASALSSRPEFASSTPHMTDETRLIVKTQQAQHGLHAEFIAAPRFTSEAVAAFLRPGAGVVTATPVKTGAGASPGTGMSNGSTQAAAMTASSAVLSPSRTGKSMVMRDAVLPSSSPSSAQHDVTCGTPTPARSFGSPGGSRLNALPAHLEAFLEEQAALEEAAQGVSAESEPPWLPTLPAYFVAPARKTPVTALSVETTVPLVSRLASPSESAWIRVVYLLGAAAQVDPGIAAAVQYWAALLEARRGAGDDDGDGKDDDDEDENENENDKDGEELKRKKQKDSATPTTDVVPLTRSARARGASPVLLLPLPRRSAVCVLPHLRYHNTTCAFTPGSSSSTGGRRVVHQLHFHLVNLGESNLLIQRISLARCGGFPGGGGSRVGLWTTADTAAYDADADADADAQELCSYLVDEVKCEANGAWLPTGAAVSTPSHTRDRNSGAAASFSTRDAAGNTSLKGWCQLTPFQHTASQAGTEDEGTDGKHVPSHWVSASGVEAAPALPTTAPCLESMPLVVSLNTPVPSDGSLNAFTAATNGPPPCFIGIRVEALVYLPPPVLSEAVERVWCRHVEDDTRQRISGYHRVTFGLSICT